MQITTNVIRSDDFSDAMNNDDKSIVHNEEGDVNY